MSIWAGHGVYHPQLGGEPLHPELWQNLYGLWIPGHTSSGNRAINWARNFSHGDLTNMDPPTDWVPGDRGLHLAFNNASAQYVNCPAAEWILFPDGITVSLQVRTTSSTGTWISKWQTADNFGFHTDGLWYSGNGSTWASISGGRLTDGKWHTYAWRYDKAAITSWRDGDQVASSAHSTITFRNTSTGNKMQIGADNRSSSGTPTADIRNVMIWSRPLPQQQLRRLHHDPTYHPLARKPRVPTAKVSAAAPSGFPFHLYYQQGCTV